MSAEPAKAADPEILPPDRFIEFARVGADEFELNIDGAVVVRFDVTVARQLARRIETEIGSGWARTFGTHDREGGPVTNVGLE